MMAPIDWEALGVELAGRFRLEGPSIHGPSHWDRVKRYGLCLAEHHEGNLVVVRLFALFHDVCREDDFADPGHGARGAALATTLHHEWFDLPDDEFEKLHYACTHHTDGDLSDDPTIGACWDADRLDIWRAGYTPSADFMSTPLARTWASQGLVGPRHVPPATR